MAEVMPLIPLRGLTVFPNMVLHFDIGREKSIVALERAMVLNQIVFLATQKNVDIELPTFRDVYSVGTVVKVKQMLKLPDGNIRVLVDGQYRAKSTALISDNPYFLVSVEETPDPAVEITADILALMRTATAQFAEYASLNPKLSPDNMAAFEEIEEPGKLADILASSINNLKRYTISRRLGI